MLNVLKCYLIISILYLVVTVFGHKAVSSFGLDSGDWALLKILKLGLIPDVRLVA